MEKISAPNAMNLHLFEEWEKKGRDLGSRVKKSNKVKGKDIFY